MSNDPQIVAPKGSHLKEDNPSFLRSYFSKWLPFLSFSLLLLIGVGLIIWGAFCNSPEKDILISFGASLASTGLSSFLIDFFSCLYRWKQKKQDSDYYLCLLNLQLDSMLGQIFSHLGLSYSDVFDQKKEGELFRTLASVKLEKQTEFLKRTQLTIDSFGSVILFRIDLLLKDESFFLSNKTMDISTINALKVLRDLLSSFSERGYLNADLPTIRGILDEIEHFRNCSKKLSVD
jgi:hypothetical protein